MQIALFHFADYDEPRAMHHYGLVEYIVLLSLQVSSLNTARSLQTMILHHEAPMVPLFTSTLLLQGATIRDFEDKTCRDNAKHVKATQCWMIHAVINKFIDIKAEIKKRPLV